VKKKKKQDYKESVSFSLDPKVIERLSVFCKKRGLAKSVIVSIAITEFFDNRLGIDDI
jgi:predicted transcriptional regulator